MQYNDKISTHWPIGLLFRVTVCVELIVRASRWIKHSNELMSNALLLPHSLVSHVGLLYTLVALH